MSWHEDLFEEVSLLNTTKPMESWSQIHTAMTARVDRSV